MDYALLLGNQFFISDKKEEIDALTSVMKRGWTTPLSRYATPAAVASVVEHSPEVVVTMLSDVQIGNTCT